MSQNPSELTIQLPPTPPKTDAGTTGSNRETVRQAREITLQHALSEGLTNWPDSSLEEDKSIAYLSGVEIDIKKAQDKNESEINGYDYSAPQPDVSTRDLYQAETELKFFASALNALLKKREGEIITHQDIDVLLQTWSELCTIKITIIGKRSWGEDQTKQIDFDRYFSTGEQEVMLLTILAFFSNDEILTALDKFSEPGLAVNLLTYITNLILSESLKFKSEHDEPFKQKYVLSADVRGNEQVAKVMKIVGEWINTYSHALQNSLNNIYQASHG